MWLVMSSGQVGELFARERTMKKIANHNFTTWSALLLNPVTLLAFCLIGCGEGAIEKTQQDQVVQTPDPDFKVPDFAQLDSQGKVDVSPETAEGDLTAYSLPS